MPPSPATITSPPLPRFVPNPVLLERQNIVTLSVTETPSSAAKSKDSAQFPFAVAIPALVGGMVLAILGALLYLHCVKRKKRKRRDAYEARRRRANRRAKEAAAKSGASSKKTSPATSRSPSSTALFTPTSEKALVTPPVPALPQNAHTSPPKSEKHSYKPPSPPHNEKYAMQPTIDAPAHDTEQSKSGSKPSRSAARVAVADRAAASAFGDPNTRHQPRKPSPLAVKAAQEQAAAAAAAAANAPRWGEGSFRRSQDNGPSPFNDGNAVQDTSFEYDAYDERPSSPSSDYDRALSGDWTGGRQVSGEWGVALGSPAHDQSFEAQQGKGGKGRYSSDPYLSVPGQQPPDGIARGKSGVYASDPYEAYHDAEELEHEYDQVKKDAPAPSGRWNLGMKGWL